MPPKQQQQRRSKRQAAAKERARRRRLLAQALRAASPPPTQPVQPVQPVQPEPVQPPRPESPPRSRQLHRPQFEVSYPDRTLSLEGAPGGYWRFQQTVEDCPATGPWQAPTVVWSLARDPADAARPHHGRQLTSLLVKPGPRGPKGRTLEFLPAAIGDAKPATGRAHRCLLSARELVDLEAAVRTPSPDWCACSQGLFLRGTPLCVVNGHLTLGPVVVCPQDMACRAMRYLLRLADDHDDFFRRWVCGSAASNPHWKASLVCWGADQPPDQPDEDDRRFVDMLRATPLAGRPNPLDEDQRCSVCSGSVNDVSIVLPGTGGSAGWDMASEVTAAPPSRCCTVSLDADQPGPDGHPPSLYDMRWMRRACCVKCGREVMRLSIRRDHLATGKDVVFSLKLLGILARDLEVPHYSWFTRSTSLVWSRCQRARLDRHFLRLDHCVLAPLAVCWRAVARVCNLMILGALGCDDTLCLEYFAPGGLVPVVCRTAQESRLANYVLQQLQSYRRMKRVVGGVWDQLEEERADRLEAEAAAAAIVQQ